MDIEEKRNGSTVQKEMMQSPRGRALLMEMLKADNPEYTPTDDEIFLDDVYSRYSKEKGNLDNMRNANAQLAELLSQNPQLALFLASITDSESPRSIPYALGSVYGNVLDLDEEEMKEYEEGYKENIARAAENQKALEKAGRNFEESKKRIVAFAGENGLDANATEELSNILYDTADQLLDGIIPDWLITTIYKGMNYDRVLQETADTAFVEGKNQAVEAKLRQKEQSMAIPDLNHAKGSGGGNLLRRKNDRGSFYDELKEVHL